MNGNGNGNGDYGSATITVCPPDPRLASWPYAPDDELPWFFALRKFWEPVFRQYPFPYAGWRKLNNEGAVQRHIPRHF